MPKVTEIRKEEGHLIVVLDETGFHASGGGQPTDFGTIRNDSFLGDVIDSEKVEGKIFLKVQAKKGDISLGDEVAEHIDLNRRIILSRMHTGEHILFKSIQRIVLEAEIEKVKIGTDVTSFFAIAPLLNWEILLKAEKNVNEIIKEGRQITVHKVMKGDLHKFIEKGLRIKIDRIKEDAVNIVEVKDFDLSACTGTHCTNTSEVKGILITSFNSVGKNRFEIHFIVDVMDKLFELSSITRRMQQVLSTDFDKLEKTAANLKTENEDFKRRIRALSSNQSSEIKNEKIGETELIYSIFEDLDRESLAKRLIEFKKKDSIAIFFNKHGENCDVMIGSNNKKINSKDAMKILQSLGGKGGGKEDFAQGLVSTNKIEEFLKIIKEKLK